MHRYQVISSHRLTMDALVFPAAGQTPDLQRSETCAAGRRHKMTTFKYFRGKNMAVGGPDASEDKNAQKFYTELNFYF